jgi:hypothetical protein
MSFAAHEPDWRYERGPALTAFLRHSRLPRWTTSFRHFWLPHWREFGSRYAATASLVVAAMAGLLTWASALPPQVSADDAAGIEFVGRDVVVRGEFVGGSYDPREPMAFVGGDSRRVICRLRPSELDRLRQLVGLEVVRVRGKLTKPGELDYGRVID